MEPFEEFACVPTHPLSLTFAYPCSSLVNGLFMLIAKRSETPAWFPHWHASLGQIGLHHLFKNAQPIFVSVSMTLFPIQTWAWGAIYSLAYFDLYPCIISLLWWAVFSWYRDLYFSEFLQVWVMICLFICLFIGMHVHIYMCVCMFVYIYAIVCLFHLSKINDSQRYLKMAFLGKSCFWSLEKNKWCFSNGMKYMN